MDGRLIQLVLGGFATGSIYAALALAIVLVNRATGMINFAQGAMAVFSTYLAWVLVTSGMPPLVAIVVAVGISFPFGALVEKVLIRRFELSDLQTAVVVSIALFMFITGLIGLFWGYGTKQFPSLFPAGAVQVGGVPIGIQSIGTTIVVLAMVIALQLLFKGTKLGLALRAVADNQESSSYSGIPVKFMLLIGWGLAATLGALAGVLVAPKVYLNPIMMDQILVYALAAVVLGGVNSPLGAVVAAWSIGIIENLAGAYVSFIGDDLKIAVPLIAMFLILLVRPQGLFGHKEVVRV